MSCTAAEPERYGNYRELLREIQSAGFLERRIGWYITRFFCTTIGLCVAVGGTALLQGSGWQVIGGVFVAVAQVRAAFLAHDAGHGQIRRQRSSNDTYGVIFANLCCGFSYGWWVEKHRRHHTYPNRVGWDPDVSHNVVAYTVDQAISPRGLSIVTRRVQAYAFFPLTTLQALSMHWNSMKAIFGGAIRNQKTEISLFVLHFGLYGYFVLTFFSGFTGLAFAFVNQLCLGLYLGFVFAPNHKGMPEDTPENGRDFLRRQCETARNVNGGVLVDFFYGGLNLQIEHHLFPSLPRPALRDASVVVENYCRVNGIAYRSCSVWQSYREILKYLHQTGRVKPAGRMTSSAVPWDSARSASDYVCEVKDPAESFVVGVVVAPEDVPANHADL